MWWISRASPVSTTRPGPGCAALPDEVVVDRRRRAGATGSVRGRPRRGGPRARGGSPRRRSPRTRGRSVGRRRPARARRARSAPASRRVNSPSIEDRLEARVSPSSCDVEEPAEVVVVDDRERDGDLPAASRGRASRRLPSGPIDAGDGGDRLLADRVERRVGDLGEELRRSSRRASLGRAREQRERACRCPSSRAASAPNRAIGPRMSRSSSSV